MCAFATDKNLFDVGLSNIAQIGDPKEILEIHETGFVKGMVQQIEFAKYRTTIDIDGNSNAWGLLIKMLMGNTVMKVASEQNYRQWFYDKLIPWTHYVPILADLSDLVEKAAWVNSNETAAEAIANAGRDLAKSLTVESSLDDIGPKLVRYLRCET